MNENEEQFDIRGFWLEQLGLEIGDIAVIIPSGHPGQQFNGELVDIILKTDGLPIALIIRQDETMPRVTVLWHAITMITKGVPIGDVDRTNSGEEVDFESLVAFAKDQGIVVPDDIQGMLDEPSEL